MGFIENTGLYRLAVPLYSGIGHIIMFHRVCPAGEIKELPGYSGIEISPEHLERLVLYFKKENYEFISPDRLYSILKGGKPDRKFMMLTFDDGYADNYTFAYPLLKRHGVPFAVYVSTGFIDNPELYWWWYPLEELVAKNDKLVIKTGGREYAFDCANEKDKYSVFFRIRSLIIECDEKQYAVRLRDIFEPYGINVHKWTAKLRMTWDMVREMSRDPLVTIGAHTVNHFALNRLSEGAAEFEIMESKRIIEKQLGKKVEHFSYPYGSGNEAGSREFDIVKKCGFKTAITTRNANIFRGHRDHLECLPRLDFGERMSGRQLKFMLSGLTQCLKNRFRRVVTL